jgi:hypothetical protein
MNIVFFCQSCGARFEVSPASAGKKGRCKKCGQLMAIPKAQELASMVAMPALAGAAVGAGAGVGGGGREAEGGNSLSWLARASSNVGLKPLTIDKMPILGSRKPRKPLIDDDLGDSKPYALAEPVRAKKGMFVSTGKPVSGAKMLWRKELGYVQRLFRWLNETAYLASVPFLLLILLGAVVGSRPLALLGATAVVLLDLGRIVAGFANIAVIPFREGIFQGILFLIPPFTFFYLSSHWGKLKKPTMRIVGPILTIGLVLVAFTLIPSLRKDGKMVSAKDIKNELRNEAKQLKGEMIDEVKKAKTVDVEQLGKQAGEKLRDVGGQINSIGKESQGPP